MMKLLLLLLAASISVASAAGPSWTIYHSWNGGEEFSRRGVLEWSEEEKSFSVTNDEQALTKEQVQAMLDYGWYQVKIDNSENDDYVLATIPACNLRRANFKDEFQVTLPRTAERITSIAYTALVSPLAPESCDELEIPESLPTLTSRVEATLDTPGMVLKNVLPHTKPPPGLNFLKHRNTKGSAGGARGPGAEEEPPTSFIRKYWYILLPLFLANFMSTPDVPQEGQGQQGGGETQQVQGSAPAAPVPAAAASPGKRAGKRRGKRG